MRERVSAAEMAQLGRDCVLGDSVLSSCSVLCERSGANSDQCPVGIVHYLDTSENSICGEINKACIF